MKVNIEHKNINWDWDNADIGFDYNEQGEEIRGGKVIGEDDEGNIYEAEFSGSIEDYIEISDVYDIKIIGKVIS